MNVVIINTYASQGGAARAARRLHLGLRQAGAQSRMLVVHPGVPDPDTEVVTRDDSPSSQQLAARWSQESSEFLSRACDPSSSSVFSLPGPGFDLTSHPDVWAADVIHLHWVPGLASPESVGGLLALGKPLVWTLHDQHPFTGGCHFSGGCDGFTDGCSACPQLREGANHLAARALAFTQTQFDARRITVVCPSRWLAQEARRSAHFAATRVETIPNGLDTHIFVPHPKAEARRELGLPETCVLLLFGAHALEERRKGGHLIAPALDQCRRDAGFRRQVEGGQVRLVLFGHQAERFDVGDFPCVRLGGIEDDTRLAALYAAADVFLCPTLEDNLPNTIMESLACGTTVLASNVGGVPELVSDGVHGRLFRRGDVAALAAGIRELTAAPSRCAALGMAGRQRIESEFSLAMQTGRYLTLFEELCSTHPAHAPFAPVARAAESCKLRVVGGFLDRLRAPPGAEEASLAPRVMPSPGVEELRCWAAATSARLRAEQVATAEARAWAERTEALLAAERKRAADHETPARRTEALLAEARAWAERTEGLLAAERKLAADHLAWAEGTEAMLAEARQARATLQAQVEQTRTELAACTRTTQEFEARANALGKALEAQRTETRTLHDFMRGNGWIRLGSAAGLVRPPSPRTDPADTAPPTPPNSPIQP